MLILLKILGIVALVVLVGAVLAVRWFFKRVRGAISDALPVPIRIHPEPEPNPHWRKGTVILQMAEQFRALGFQDVGAFSIPEMGGIQFLAFVHPREQFHGCVYDHLKLEPTFDVVCRLTDSTSVTGTNTRLGEALEQRPGRETLRLDQASVQQVFDAVRQHPGAARARQAVSAGQFLSDFKKAHAEYMNWRLSRGGTTRDEIRRQAQQDGEEVTDELIEGTYEAIRSTYIEQLKDACVAQYLDDARLSADEWERRQVSLLAIPETLELKEVVGSLSDALCLDDEQRHQLDQVETQFGRSGLDIIADILSRQIASLRVKKVGEVQEPVRAWILELPEESLDELETGKDA